MAGVFAHAIEAAFVEMGADDRGDGSGMRVIRIVLAIAQHLGELFGREIDVQFTRRAGRSADRSRRASGLPLAHAAEEQVADLAEGSLGVLRVGWIHGPDLPR